MASGTRNGRTFLREVSASGYSLSEERDRRLAAPRRRPSAGEGSGTFLPLSPDPSGSRAWWILEPGDENFLTQTLEVHFRELPPATGNAAHGHQNGAIFYWLEGEGYDVHDGVKYPWRAGDAVFVQPDCVHEHVNSSDRERALAVVIKAKSLWMYLGLFQQGSQRAWEGGDDDDFGPRQRWDQLISPGLLDGHAVVSSDRLDWERTEDGLVKALSTAEHTDHMNTAVDLWAQRVPAGGHSSRHWHMADEVLFVLSGRGVVRQWDVRAEIDDRYYARIAKTPSEWEFGPGDLVYVPTNTVHQIIAATDEPAELLVAHNRAFRLAGYDNVVRLDPPSS